MAKNMKDTYREVFGEDRVEEPYKLEEHVWASRPSIGKQVCLRCGLVALRNQFTSWSIRMGCRSEDHPQYSAKRKQLGN
jgi:hypothetical protein